MSRTSSVIVISFLVQTAAARAVTTPESSISNDLTEAFFSGATYICKTIADSYNATVDFERLKNTLNIVYASSLKTEYVPLRYAAKNILMENLINFDLDTFVIIHGFNDNPESDLPNLIGKKLVQKEEFNVFLLDYSKTSKGNYFKAAGILKYVGEMLADVLFKLHLAGLRPVSVHLVGLSLGAQLCASTGKYFQALSGEKLGQITGLDPAGPCFTYARSETRLDKSDALFVDIIHVNMGVHGIVEAVGHADFYVNGGGPNQPGCWSLPCSHVRAGFLYAESISLLGSFIGVQCPSLDDFNNFKCNDNNISVMGFGINTKSDGLYYLRTNSKSIFGLRLEGASPQTWLSQVRQTFSLRK